MGGEAWRRAEEGNGWEGSLFSTVGMLVREERESREKQRL